MRLVQGSEVVAGRDAVKRILIAIIVVCAFLILADRACHAIEHQGDTASELPRMRATSHRAQAATPPDPGVRVRLGLSLGGRE